MSSHIWHGYLAVERYADSLNQDNWITLIEGIRSLQTVNGKAQYLLQERGNLDKFEVVIDDDNSIWYSNIYIWEARYAAGEIEFENFKAALVDLFEVDPEDVTYNIGTTMIRERLSCFARFKYNDKNRIRVGLFGCEDDANLCNWNESRIECDGYLIDNRPDWENSE